MCKLKLSAFPFALSFQLNFISLFVCYGSSEALLGLEPQHD